MTTEQFKDMQKKDNARPSKHWNCVKYSAERRGIPFTLSREEYVAIVTGAACVYGSKSRVTPIHVGVDRASNDKGYESGNCQPCCCRHNRIKSSIFTHEEMLLISSTMLGAMDCGDASSRAKPSLRDRQMVEQKLKRAERLLQKST